MKGVLRSLARPLPKRVRVGLHLLLRRVRSAGKDRQQRFEEIYETARWAGSSDVGFTSGRGSAPENTQQYESFVVRFVENNNIKSIIDAGCGDFGVGSRLLAQLPSDVRYIGVDIVSPLVEALRDTFRDDRLDFVCLDVVEEDPPGAELLLIREVLQHLSNADITRVLERLPSYKYALLTNSTLISPTTVNVDIPTGALNRVSVGSGLDLTQAPFALQGDVVMSIPHATNPSVVVETILCRRSLVPPGFDR